MNRKYDLAKVGEVGVWGKELEKEPLYWVYADDISQELVDETAKQEHEPVVNIVTGLRLKETS
jgi:hypothetical protein